MKPTKQHTTSRSFLVYLSPQAKQGLRQQAIIAGYIASDELRNHNGLSAYLNAIASGAFDDTRPPHIAASDEEQIAHNLCPVWNLSYPRKRHRIALTRIAKARLYTLAIDHLIANPHNYNSMNNLTSTLGVVLEAIGTGWLTPRNVPHGYLIRKQVDMRQQQSKYRYQAR